MTRITPKYVFATNNPHKLDEVRRIVGDSIIIMSLKDIGCEDDIPETESTLQGNAHVKAQWIYDKFGCDCFADDTGLEVESLGGAPGVKTARYASESGHDTTANMRLLLENLKGCDNRNAQFRTVIALFRGGKEYFFEGRIKGTIADTPKGVEGFGYDPVFIPEGESRSFAELSADEKNAISHRAQAVKMLIDFISEEKR